MTVRSLWGISVCALMTSIPAWPQASNSTVRGAVRDQAQAMIPKATVTLVNTATNNTRTTETNDSGLYVFPGVTPGSYRISAELAGMRKFEGTLTVRVQQDAVVDMTLDVAQAATAISVEDVTPLGAWTAPRWGTPWNVSASNSCPSTAAATPACCRRFRA